MKKPAVFLFTWFSSLTLLFGQQAAQGYTPAPESQYAQLSKMLAFYEELASDKCYWTFFSPDIRLQPGDRSELVPGLRNNLIVLNDLDAKYASADFVYDSLLAAAVLRFQRRHGLTESPVLNPETIEALNVPLSRRSDQIRLNMSRWRQFEAGIRQPYLMVNIPDFTLEAIDQNEAVLKTRVVVGKKTTRTQVLQSEINYIVLNPSWNVPSSIARNEILLLQKRNPDYLKKNRMKIYQPGSRTEVDPDTVNWQAYTPKNFNLAIEQVPGEGNALGKVKFFFPNPYSIYLHDTPQKTLFRNRVRMYSHGCVRVENPLELAAYLLRGDPDWTLARLKAYTQNTTETRTIKLPKPVPVALTYFTAWVDSEGILQFRNDVYQLDPREQYLEPASGEVLVIRE